ncbi:ccaat-box-binding transcription factor [Grosmannia clavigera kw1407]|uniref:Ccaat-box-binding transcription factor n=1 Tax=Grosmannia clavigera (strain kw1407 / UAMH 11150) TaxID=655863 RepID=F0X9C1_GROCL|nr:ccaat-box-binding transcription factor [Grosmannia clavigera kw1407]EFX05867.1 ccaat-box-binding transcription factor [Grosmannia clavigera kw1407]
MAPTRSKPKPHMQSAAAPAFNKAALSQLTAKLEKDLEKASVQNLQGGKRKRSTDAVDDEAEADKHKASRAPKRQAAADEPKASTASAATKETADTNASKKSVMLEEIKALGGDEGDLELVDGIDSDAEDGAGGGKAADAVLSLDDSFKNELASFAASLGFDQAREDDLDDAAAEEELVTADADNDNEQEGEEEEEEDEEEEQPEPAVEKKEEIITRQEVPKPAPAALESLIPRNPKFSKLTFEPRPDWHQVSLPVLPAPVSDDISRLSTTIANLKTYGQTLMEADGALYQKIVASSSSHRFMSTIMSSGTMSDKVSALTLEVQEAPVHNIKAFESLLGLAAKRSRGQAIAALGALVDLLGNGVVLPPDRRLRAFHAQPGLVGVLQAAEKVAKVERSRQYQRNQQDLQNQRNQRFQRNPKNQKNAKPLPETADASADRWAPGQRLPDGITKAHLVQWAYEDWLKDAFFRLLQVLEVWCGDEIEYSRTRALDFVFGLLRDKPEQEANLLRLLVNKLGDRERKIASRASLRAKYYAINTLNQTILSTKEPTVADSLVRVYFELFLSLLKSGALGAIDMPDAADDIAASGSAPKKNDKRGGKRDDRRRDKPKPADDDKDKDAKKDKEKNTGNERDVAEKLVSSLLTGVNRSIPFASADDTTLEKHIDTLFRVTHSSNFNTSIQALVLVQQVAVAKQIAVDRFYRTLYESLLDPRLVTSSKQAMYLNLLFRALKNDVDVRRVKAFVKRMLQISTLHQPPFVCGILFLIVELETSFPDLKSLLNSPEENEEDEEEVYHDVVMTEDGRAAAAEQPSFEPAAKIARATYDGRKRDPEYSNAQKSCLWELVPYFHHFHPSVMAFATNLLVRQTSLPKPDMANHTLMHFLDKFVYRNAKATDGKQHGASIMQPLVSAGDGATTSANGASQIVAPAKAASQQQAQKQKPSTSVNSAAFWNKKVEDVAAEDIFFHAYFSQVGKPAQTSRAAKRDAQRKEKEAAEAAAAAGSDAGSDADEEEIWKALKGSRPEVDADTVVDMDDLSDDDDDDMSGLEELLNIGAREHGKPLECFGRREEGLVRVQVAVAFVGGRVNLARVEAVEAGLRIWSLVKGAEVHVGRRGFVAAGRRHERWDAQLAKQDDAVGRRGDADEHQIVRRERGQLVIRQAGCGSKALWLMFWSLSADVGAYTCTRTPLPRTVVVVAQMHELLPELVLNLAKRLDGLVLGQMGLAQIGRLSGSLQHRSAVVYPVMMFHLAVHTIVCALLRNWNAIRAGVRF